MLMASLAILVVFVLRLLVLMFDSSAFQFPSLISLSSDAVERALWFMVAGTVAFWLGAKLVLKAQTSKVRGLEGTSSSRLLLYRDHLIVMGLAVVSTVFVINVSLGVRWIGSNKAFLMPLLPKDILAFALMYLAVGHWKILTPLEKAGVVAFFLILFVSGVAVGSRSALFSAVFPWLTAAILIKRDPKIPIKSLVAGSLALLVLAPLLEFIMLVRDLVRAELLVFSNLPLLELWGVSDFGLQDALRMLTDRMQGFDILVAVVNYKPEGIEPYLTLLTLGKATLAGLIPDLIWSTDAPATGGIFATFYQGFAWGAAHYGGWSGFGFFYAYFGPMMGILGLALLGALVTMILPKLVKGSVLLEAWAAFFLFSFVFGALVSGNFDGITSDFLVQGVTISGLLWLFTMPHRAMLHARRLARLEVWR